MHKVKDREAVSVVIPTYNGWQLLQKNLDLVLSALADGDELVIIDDASTDQTLIQLQKRYGLTKQPDLDDFSVYTSISTQHQVNIKIIINRQNVRFAASVNRAVAQATHRLVWLLNNDVMPRADALSYLAPHFDNPKMFAVGCHELELNHGQVSGGKNKLWFERGMFVHSRADSYQTGETAWASGGSALFDRHKWLSLRGFDLLFYPAYWEDVDLSFRAKRQGWLVWFEAKAVVDHNHESTNNDVFGQEKLAQLGWTNARKFTGKNANWWQGLLFLVWTPWHIIRRWKASHAS